MAPPRIWLNTRTFDVRRVLRTAGVWGGVLVVMLLSRQSEQPTVSEKAASQAVAGTAASVGRSASGAGHSAMPAASQALIAAATPASTGASRRGVGLSALCRQAQGKDPAQLADTPDVRRARAGLIEAMRRDDGPWGTAAALLLGAVRSAPARVCQGSNCTPNPSADRAWLGSADALARMAAAANDARVYQFAFMACHRSPNPGGNCSGLSAQQWARLDAGNAGPWLFIAAQAQQDKNFPALDEAMHHIATARRVEIAWSALEQVVSAHVSKDDDAQLLAGTALLADVAALQSAAAVPGYRSVADYCKDELLRDSNRRQTCSGIAEALTTRASTLADLSSGIELARQVGWPAPRVEQLAADRRALTAKRAQLSAAESGCEAARQRLASAADVATFGEIGAARRASTSTSSVPSAGSGCTALRQAQCERR